MPDDRSLSGPAAVHSWVSDGTVPRVWTPKYGLVLVLLAMFLLGLGVITSLDVNAESLPDYRGRVIVIGLVWGAVMVAVVALVVTLAVVVSQRRLRRRVRRLFPAGSTTEVEIGDDDLVVRGPTGERRLPYRDMARIKATDVWLRVFMRGRARPELLPAGLLPEPAVGVLRARAGQGPPMVEVPDGEPTCSMVVPPGWDAHLAAVARRATRRSIAFWVQTVGFVLLAGLLGMRVSPGWWLLAPLLVLVRLVVQRTRTNDAMARALPAGSVAATYVLGDRFVSRNAGGTREVLFADVGRAVVDGDVVVLRLRSTREYFLLARALLPPHVLAQLATQANEGSA